MKVRFNTSISDGAGQKFASGHVAEVDDELAKVWIGHGLVESMEEPQKREAVKRAPRRATKSTKPKH